MAAGYNVPGSLSALAVADAPREGHTARQMKAFLGFAGFLPVLCAVACSSVGTGGSGGPEAGGGDVGASGQGGAPLTGDLVIKNLNVTVDKIDGQVNLTFILENGTAKDIADCNNGSLSASSGEDALIDPYQYGECGGFEPMEPDTVAAFCADSAFDSVCNYGLYSGGVSSPLAIHGASEAATNHPWEAVGTEYTVTLEFVMSDAEILQATASATIQ
jgi:hypothetical protein